VAAAASAAASSAQRGWWWPLNGAGDEDEGDLPSVGGGGVVTDVIDGVTSRDEVLPPAPRRRGRHASARRSLRPHEHRLSTLAMPQQGLVIPDNVPNTRKKRMGLMPRPHGPKMLREYDVDAEEMASVVHNIAAAPPPHQPSKSLVSTKTVAKVATGAAGLRAVSESMMEQCLRFARWAKQQDLQGPELVHVWKSTCEPAVMSGAATERYRIMCEALGGAVADFGKSPKWAPESACIEVVRVFKESGVGGSPLKG